VRAVAKNKGKAGIAVAGVALAAGAILLAKKTRARRKRNDGAGALASSVDELSTPETADSSEAAMNIPVARDADLPSESGSQTRATTRRGSMTAAPVPGARFNGVRNDRKETRD
jgi:hypothetical protein